MQSAVSASLGPRAGLVVLVAAFGCRQTAPPVKQLESRNVPRVLAYAPGLRLPSSPAAEPVETQPEPTAAYGSLSAACGAVHRLMSERLDVPVKRVDSVSFENEFVRARRTGCVLTATGAFHRAGPDTAGTRSPDGDLATGLMSAGWVNVPRYTADGPDGSVFGLRSRETLCIVRGSWDGGDDSDSTYVPSDDWELVAHCAPQEPGDSV